LFYGTPKAIPPELLAGSDGGSGYSHISAFGLDAEYQRRSSLPVATECAAADHAGAQIVVELADIDPVYREVVCGGIVEGASGKHASGRDRIPRVDLTTLPSAADIST
jgi:hypothetical protein